MKLKSFFKLVNRKINKYDKAIDNPFKFNSYTIIWVEENINDKKIMH